MRFQATDDQIREVMALAVNASSPMGMGFLHYKPGHKFTAADFQLGEYWGGLDYVGGRMVKLWIGRDKPANGWWHAPDWPPRPDYQSWCGTYPTWAALLEAAGITVFESEAIATKETVR